MKQTTGTLNGLPRRLVERVAQLYVLLFIIFCDVMTVYAAAPAAGGTGDTALAKWNAVIGFLVPWIQRLGGVVMLIGGIMFGLAFKNDDADGKTRALQTLVAGAIVIAVGAGSDVFLT